MSDSELVLYEALPSGVARIALNRPQTRNAQNTALLYALNDAFNRAAQDDSIKVIVLSANGPHFSSGHDLRETDQAQAIQSHGPVGTWCGFGCAGAESSMAIEREVYLDLCERWRNIPKPTIAAVQGKVIAGGLMLVWPCDLIVAAEDAQFIDNTVAMGVSGVEWFNHGNEMPLRKAKEMLFTSEWISARQALSFGMVNHVVGNAELLDFTLGLAAKIARQPLFALKLAKEALNAVEDQRGRRQALQTAFALHQLCHAHNMMLFGEPMDPGFFKK